MGIDLFSKFTMAKKVSNLKRNETLWNKSNNIGPPNVNIEQWCQQLNVVLDMTTAITGISDIKGSTRL